MRHLLSAAVARSCVAAVSLALLAAAPARPQDDATLTPSGAPPEELAPAVREVLIPEGLRVERDGQVLAEYWLAAELPLAGDSEGLFGIEFGGLTGGALVGAVRFENPFIDYRDVEIDPGVYTLRYWIQPADGDHMGVSTYRDFLVLGPAAMDQEPQKLYDKEGLLELGQAASGRVHPGVVALFPVWDEVAAPGQLTRNDADQLTLAIPHGDGTLTLGLVIEGIGDIP